MLNTVTLFLLLFGQVSAPAPTTPEMDAPLPDAAVNAPADLAVPETVPTGEPSDIAPPEIASDPEIPSLDAPAVPSVGDTAQPSTPELPPISESEPEPAPSAPSAPALAPPSKPILHKNPRMIPPPLLPPKNNAISDPINDANDPMLVNPSALDASASPAVSPSPYSAMDYSSGNQSSSVIEDRALQNPTLPSFDSYNDDSMYDTQLAPNQGKGHIMPIDQAEVPAQEQGVLVKFHVREGMIVEKDAPLAQIDDEQAKMSVEVQQAKLNAAEKEASNDVNIRYAKAARNVADAEVKSAKETIARVPGAVPATEIRKLELSLVQATLQIEQASNQFEISKYQVDVSRAELNAAKLGLARRVVNSPISGVIVEKYRNEGEWVKPGDPIVKVVYLDKLRVKTTMDINKMPLQKVMNHTASITVVQQPGMTFKGKVVFANPVVQSGGAYEVWIDVDNVLGKDNFWSLQPGMNAIVTIE